MNNWVLIDKHLRHFQRFWCLIATFCLDISRIFHGLFTDLFVFRIHINSCSRQTEIWYLKGFVFVNENVASGKISGVKTNKILKCFKDPWIIGFSLLLCYSRTYLWVICKSWRCFIPRDIWIAKLWSSLWSTTYSRLVFIIDESSGLEGTVKLVYIAV